MPKKRGLGQFADLSEGGWQERGGGVFEGVSVDTPIHIMDYLMGEGLIP